ncbi:unnamed protein product, partial [Closterium sp. Naga37s-1]
GEMEQVQQQLQRMQWEEAAEGALMRRASVDELLALQAQGERLPTGSAVVARVHAVVAAGSDWQARAQRALQEGCSLEEGEAMSREAEAIPASLAGHAHLMSVLASARAAAARGDQLLLAALTAEVVALPVRPPHAPQLASLLSSLAAWQSATSHALHTATTFLSPPTTVTPTTAAAAQSTQASPAAVPIAAESGATPLASAPAAPAGKPPPELLVPAAAASASAAELSSLLTQGAALGVAVPELPAVRAVVQRLHWEVAAHALLSGTADTAVQSGGVAQDSAVQGGGERRGKPSVEEVEALVAAYPLTDALAHPPPHPTPSAPPLPSAAPSEGLAQPAASAPSPPPSARLSLLHSALADARQWVQAANEMLTRGPASCEVQEVEAMVARGMALQVCVHDKCHQLSTVIASHREWVSEVQQLLAPRLPAPTSPPPLLPRAPATTLAHLKGLQVRGSSSVVASGEARQVQQAVAALDDWLVACCAALRGGSGDEGARGGGEGAQGEGSVAPGEGKGLHGEGKGRVCEEEVVRKLKHMHSSVQAALHRISSLARRTAALSHLTALPAQPFSASANAPHPAVLAGSAVGATADAVAAAASPAATAPTATAPAHAPAPGVAPAVAAAVRGAPEASEAPVPAPPGAAAAAVAGSVSSSDTVCWCAVLHHAHPACAASAGFSGGSDGQAVVGGQAGGGGGDVRVRGKRSGGRRAAAVVCGAVGRESGAGGAGMSWEKREEKAGEARGDREGNMGAVRLEKGEAKEEEQKFHADCLSYLHAAAPSAAQDEQQQEKAQEQKREAAGQQQARAEQGGGAGGGVVPPGTDRDSHPQPQQRQRHDQSTEKQQPLPPQQQQQQQQQQGPFTCPFCSSLASAAVTPAVSALFHVRPAAPLLLLKCHTTTGARLHVPLPLARPSSTCTSLFHLHVPLPPAHASASLATSSATSSPAPRVAAVLGGPALSRSPSPPQDRSRAQLGATRPISNALLSLADISALHHPVLATSCRTPASLHTQLSASGDFSALFQVMADPLSQVASCLPLDMPLASPPSLSSTAPAATPAAPDSIAAQAAEPLASWLLHVNAVLSPPTRQQQQQHLVQGDHTKHVTGTAAAAAAATVGVVAGGQQEVQQSAGQSAKDGGGGPTVPTGPAAAAVSEAGTGCSVEAGGTLAVMQRAVAAHCWRAATCSALIGRPRPRPSTLAQLVQTGSHTVGTTDAVLGEAKQRHEAASEWLSCFSKALSSQSQLSERQAAQRLSHLRALISHASALPVDLRPEIKVSSEPAAVVMENADQTLRRAVARLASRLKADTAATTPPATQSPPPTAPPTASLLTAPSPARTATPLAVAKTVAPSGKAAATARGGIGTAGAASELKASGLKGSRSAKRKLAAGGEGKAVRVAGAGATAAATKGKRSPRALHAAALQGGSCMAVPACATTCPRGPTVTYEPAPASCIASPLLPACSSLPQPTDPSRMASRPLSPSLPAPPATSPAAAPLPAPLASPDACPPAPGAAAAGTAAGTAACSVGTTVPSTGMTASSTAKVASSAAKVASSAEKACCLEGKGGEGQRRKGRGDSQDKRSGDRVRAIESGMPGTRTAGQGKMSPRPHESATAGQGKMSPRPHESATAGQGKMSPRPHESATAGQGKMSPRPHESATAGQGKMSPRPHESATAGQGKMSPRPHESATAGQGKMSPRPHESATAAAAEGVTVGSAWQHGRASESESLGREGAAGGAEGGSRGGGVVEGGAGGGRRSVRSTAGRHPGFDGFLLLPRIR